MDVKYRKDFYLLLLTIALLYVWAGFMEDTRAAYLFWLGIAILITPLITIVRGWFGLNVLRRLPKGKIYAGDRVKVVLEVENTNYIPFLWLNVTDHYPARYRIKHDMKGEHSSSINFLPKGSRYIAFDMNDVPRGKMRWSKTSVLRTDLLGFIKTCKDKELTQELVVYPKYVDLSGEVLLNKTEENHGMTRFFKGNDYSQMSGVREYERGDKLSLIHWKVSARKNSLMSKEFFPLLNQETHIILDCDRNNYPDEYNADFELAVSVTASLANSIAKFEKDLVVRLNNKHRDIITFNDRSLFVNQVMESLALVEADGEYPIESMLNNHYFKENKGVTIIIVTNKIDERILNKLYLSKGMARSEIFLVGEKIDSNVVSKYKFVSHIKSLEQLVANKGVRRVSNE